tara:strand:- start:94 stop:1566 length:1473 start_codon:yes stop_codon:yes gene_type:complete
MTATLPFIFLFVCMAGFVGLNADPYGDDAKEDGDKGSGSGMSYYWGTKSFPLPDETFYKPEEELKSLMQDAYGQVFFSVGVCVGVFFAYGSYNPIKQPVIANAFFIGIMDFVFSIMAGFVTWGAIGYLQKVEDPNYNQTNSVGLTFIAFPTIAAKLDGDENNDMGAFFTMFMLLLYVAGIDSAWSYIEALVTNILDHFKMNSMTENREGVNHGMKRIGAALFVVIMGIALTALFTTNFGWILFDLVDHYISSYIIVAVGFMQCVAVGWLFEYETTAMVSQEHTRSLKYLGVIFWLPTGLTCFYCNAAFPDYQWIGAIIIVFFTLVSFCCSYKVSKMSFGSWYHEILLCGVDKLSMSITSLSNADGSRSMWMPVFEVYFGICIKFVNPAALLFMFCSNLITDIESPYAEQPVLMHVLSSILVYICVLIVIVPMFSCDYQEKFEFDPRLEFMADQIYSDGLKGGTVGGPPPAASNKIDPGLELEMTKMALKQ